MRVEWNFLDFGLSDVAAERFFDVPDAIVYVVRMALGYHFNATVRQIANLAGQLITISCIKSGKAKADTLNPTGENYMSGGLAHRNFILTWNAP